MSSSALKCLIDVCSGSWNKSRLQLGEISNNRIYIHIQNLISGSINAGFGLFMGFHQQ